MRVEVDVNTCTAIMKDAHCCCKVETRTLHDAETEEKTVRIKVDRETDGQTTFPFYPKPKHTCSHANCIIIGFLTILIN